MFGGWKVKALKLKTTILVGGHQTAKELPPTFKTILEIYAEANRVGEAFMTEGVIERLPPLTDAERPLHEPADINGWHFDAMMYLKDGELWWLVHAIRKDERPPREKDVKLLNHVLELLGCLPTDAVIAPGSSPATENLPFGWWTWRNTAPLQEMQVNPDIKGPRALRIVRKGAPETDGFKRMGND